MPEFTGFSGEMIFGIASLLMALVLWVRVLSNKRDSDDWLNHKLYERQQEIERGQSPTPPATGKTAQAENHDLPKGPWG